MSTATPFPSLNPWQESKSKLKYDGTKSNGLYKWIIVNEYFYRTRSMTIKDAQDSRETKDESGGTHEGIEKVKPEQIEREE